MPGRTMISIHSTPSSCMRCTIWSWVGLGGSGPMRKTLTLALGCVRGLGGGGGWAVGCNCTLGEGVICASGQVHGGDWRWVCGG